MCCDLPRSTLVGCVVFAVVTCESVPGHILHLRNAERCCVQRVFSSLQVTFPSLAGVIIGCLARPPPGSRKQRELRPVPCTHPTPAGALSARGDALGEMSESDAFEGRSGRDVEGRLSVDALGGCSGGETLGGCLSGGCHGRTISGDALGHVGPPAEGRTSQKAERGSPPIVCGGAGRGGGAGAEVEGRPPTLCSLIGGRRAPVP